MSMMRWCAVMLLVTGLAGCGGEESPPEPTFANWPASLHDFRFQWSAEPGIDLVAGPAVPCGRIWSRTGSRTLRATSAPPTRVLIALSRRHCLQNQIRAPAANWWTSGRYPKPSCSAPQGRSTATSSSTSSSSPRSRVATAHMCATACTRSSAKARKRVSTCRSSAMTPARASRHRRPQGVAGGVHRHPAGRGAPAMVTVAQRGPNPAPVGDVFGPWRITGASDDSWGTPITRESIPFGKPGGVDRISECSDRMPQWRTERDAIIESVLDTPPDAEPASPGWPDGTA